MKEVEIKTRKVYDVSEEVHAVIQKLTNLPGQSLVTAGLDEEEVGLLREMKEELE